MRMVGRIVFWPQQQIATRTEAITSRLEVIAIRLEAIERNTSHVMINAIFEV